jgi:hypothetical protein
MTLDNFFISLQKQKQINTLWDCINDQKYFTESTSIIQYAISEIPRECGIDFSYLNIKVEDLNAIITSGYCNNSYAELSKLFSSALVSMIVGLPNEISSVRIASKEEEIFNKRFNKLFTLLVKPIGLLGRLFRPNTTSILNEIFSLKRPHSEEKCVLSAIKFVVYASFARQISQFYENDWEITSASFVGQGIGLIAQIPEFSAYMDMVFECIFDKC